MRLMNIPPFGRKIEIGDLDFFVRSRLGQTIVVWPEQAIPLVGYMAWPNDPDAREASVQALRGWFAGSQVIPARLRPIQTDWARVADIFSLHHDLTAGGHQQRRGGPSIGKAITVAAGSIQARGARSANLWRAWKEYKDVAHLVTAATIICTEARRRAIVKPFGEFGLPSSQLQPFPIAMMMPDFVIALAQSLQEHGLGSIPQACEQPMLDPETLWRIAPDINVVTVPPPVRQLDSKAIAMTRLAHAFRALHAPAPIPPLRPLYAALRTPPPLRDGAVLGLTDRMVDAVDTLDYILRDRLPGGTCPPPAPVLSQPMWANSR